MPYPKPEDIPLPEDDLAEYMESLTVTNENTAKLEEKNEKDMITLANLPVEIVGKIAVHIKQNHLWSFARTTKRNYEIVKPQLYRKVFVGVALDADYEIQAYNRFYSTVHGEQLDVPMMIIRDSEYLKQMDIGKHVHELVLGAHFYDKENTDLLIQPILELLSIVPNISLAVILGMWGRDLWLDVIKGLATYCPKLRSLNISWNWRQEPLPQDIDLTAYPTSLRLKHLDVCMRAGSEYPTRDQRMLCRVTETLAKSCKDTLVDFSVSFGGPEWEDIASVDFDELAVLSHLKKFEYEISAAIIVAQGNLMLIDLEAMSRKLTNLEELRICIPRRKLPVNMQDLLVRALQQLTHCRSLRFDFNTSSDDYYRISYNSDAIRDEADNGFHHRKAIIQALAVAMPALEKIWWSQRHLCFDNEMSVAISRTVSPCKRVFITFHLATNFLGLMENYNSNESVVFSV